MTKVAILFWSKSGNTEKVASVIKECFELIEADITYLNVNDARKIDFLDYDLVCLGFPDYRWLPPKPVIDFIEKKFRTYFKDKEVKYGAPVRPGKHAVIFCTYCGAHTGEREAIPAGKFAGQLFEHLGFTVLDELYVVGEYHRSKDHSTLGKLGDVRGRPDENDLNEVRNRMNNMIKEHYKSEVEVY